MKKGMDINQRIPFIFPDDAEEPKSVFILRPLTAPEFAEFSASNTNGKMVISADAIYNVLDRAVVEVVNWTIGDEVITAKDQAGKRRVFESLELGDLNILLNAILEMNKLGRVDQKNS